MSATLRDLVFISNSIPEGSTWTATGLGKNAWHIAAATISLGGHVRVGFEDNLYLERGRLAKSNGEMVEKAASIAKLLGREIATPAEAREILGLKPLV
jgi:3-keto-5-aminohexanoate cleavage enzyme